MKSNDFPGKQKPALAGIRTPAAVPQSNVSASNGRAAMLSRVMDQESVKPLEGEWFSGSDTLTDVAVVDVVRSPYQPRLVFKPKLIEELAASIDEIGLAKPILVRPLNDGRFELVGGERRWRAVQILGWERIQAVIKHMSDDVAMLLALADNEHEELTDYELAVSYDRYLKNGQDKSQRALARRLGIDNSVVSRCLELMKLSQTIRTALDSNPELITANYAKRFVDLAAAHPHIVERQVLSMAEKGIKQEQALRMVAQKIAAISHEPHPAQIPKSVSGIGSMKVAGRKLEIKCEKGIDPTRLMDKFEEFLKTVDPESMAADAS